MQVLDNPALFLRYEREIIEAVNTSIPKGGDFNETLERLREHGRDDVALELEELAGSRGSTNPETFRRYFERLRRPHVAEALRKLVEKLSDNGTSLGMAQAQIAEIFKWERAIQEPAGPEDGGAIMWNDPDTDPDEKLPEPIVKDLLYPGLTFVSGLWKECMKTTIITALIQHVAQGLPFLGRTVRQRRCAFVQLDTPIPRFLATARELRAGMSTHPYGILGMRGRLDLTQTADQERLFAWCEEERIELLAIDALSSVFPANENDAELVKPVVRGFLLGRLRDTLGIDVVMLAHPNRSGTSRTRGSGEWEAAADSLWTLTAKKRGDLTETVTISITGRHAHHRLTLAFDWPQPACPGIRIREVKTEEAAGDSIEAAVTTEWSSTKEISKAAKKRWEVTRQGLAELLARGVVDTRTNPEGKGEQWKLRDESSRELAPEL